MTSNHTAPRRLLLHRLLPVAFCLLFCSGCAIIGVIAAKTVGPPPDPAKYKPKQEPILVVVESYQRQAAFEVAGDELAINLSDLLKKNKVAPVVPADKLLELRTEHPDSFGQMKIQMLGQKLGAGQVLYVDMKQMEVTSPTGSDVYTGNVDVRVKVVDVASGRTLWPTGTADGYAVHADSSMVRITETASQHAMQTELLQDIAQEITKLFYDFRPDFEEQKHE